MEERGGRDGGVKGTSHPEMHISSQATCICMGRRPETREVYKRNETEVDGWKREKEEMGG